MMNPQAKASLQKTLHKSKYQKNLPSGVTETTMTTTWCSCSDKNLSKPLFHQLNTKLIGTWPRLTETQRTKLSATSWVTGRRRSISYQCSRDLPGRFLRFRLLVPHLNERFWLPDR
jgi:hypothetical protein